MKKYIINRLQEDPIPIIFFPAKEKTSKTMIYVGGSGDDRYKFVNVAKKLIERNFPYNIVTFSFRGRETNSRKSLKHQLKDLKDVIDFIIDNKGAKSIVLICTSMGAYSTSLILLDKRYTKLITRTIFVDPADFYLSKENEPDGGGTWTGYQEYKTTSETSSSLLKKIKSNVKIDVIYFSIRNYGPEGYASLKERSIDNPRLFSRLNNKMVKSFYENTPKRNRGKYIEDKKLPHAYLRDGYVERNELRIIKLIVECLGL